MPNWTNNRIVITGTKQSIDAFIKAGKPYKDSEGKDMYSMESWLPMPMTFLKNDTTNYPEKFPEAVAYQKKKYGIVGWYAWRLLNYGCKWDEEIEFYKRDDTDEKSTLTLLICTPWSAPFAFMERISQKFPNLRMELYSHYEDSANAATAFEGGAYEGIDLGEIIDDAKLYAKHQLDNDGSLTDEERKSRLRMMDRFFDNDLWDASCDLTDEELYFQLMDAFEWMDDSL